MGDEARKTVQKIPYQEELFDGDLGPFSWTQGYFWELRSWVTLLSFSRNFGSFAGGCAVLFACRFTNFLLAKYTLPGSTPVCGKKRFFFKNLFQESGAAAPSLAFPSCALQWGDPDGIQTSPGAQGTCTGRERLGIAGCPCSGRAWRRNLPGFRHNL